MRAKLGPLLRAGGGLLACGYIILIAVRGQLGFYIHPRYHLLAVVATVAGSMLLIIDIILQLRHKADRSLGAFFGNDEYSGSTGYDGSGGDGQRGLSTGGG